MKATKIFMMAALALTFAACSNNDDIDLAQQPIEQPANGEITITATLEANDGASTRALQDPDGENKIASTWETTDQFAILYNDGTKNTKSIATVDKIDGTTVTITFTIPASLASNTACQIVYPASAAKADNSGADVATALATQNGAIGDCPEVRVGTATIDKDNHNLTSVTKLTAQNAIFKFTLKDIAGTSDKAATEFIVSNASGDVITTVTPASATNELYVALPALAVGTYWFNATVGGKPYIAKATVSTATTAGNYYQTQVNMATLGDLMAANGKFYADAAAITAASTTAIGVIAYLGTDNFTENGTTVGGNTFAGHGLVLCLKNALSNVSWSTNTSSQAYTGNAYVSSVEGLTRTEGVSGYAATAALATVEDAVTIYPAAYQAKNYTGLKAPTGTTGWFLPSAQQWVKMQTGLGGLSESSITWRSWFDPDHTAAGKWEAALSKAGSGNYDSMTERSYFWSSSEYSAYYAVLLDVVATGTGNVYGFYWYNHGKDYTEGNRYRVRPVLAF